MSYFNVGDRVQTPHGPAVVRRLATYVMDKTGDQPAGDFVLVQLEREIAKYGEKGCVAERYRPHELVKLEET